MFYDDEGGSSQLHEDTDSEDVTSDDDNSSSTALTELEEDEALFASLRDERHPENDGFWEEQAVNGLAGKLHHLPPGSQEFFRVVLERHYVIAQFLKDLHESNAPVKYFFELIDNTHISHRNRRQSPRHIEVVGA